MNEEIKESYIPVSSSGGAGSYGIVRNALHKFVPVSNSSSRCNGYGKYK
jgi:hypothetical protein